MVKKSTKVLISLFIFAVIISLVSCQDEKLDIKSVDGYPSIYCYEVERAILKRADNGELLEETKLTNQMCFSVYENLTSITESYWLLAAEYFEDAELDDDNYNLYSDKYKCEVFVEFVMKEIIKKYSASYKYEKNDLITISYYDIRPADQFSLYSSSFSSYNFDYGRVFSKVITYEEMNNEYKNHVKNTRGLSKDSEKYETLTQKYKEKMSGVAVITEKTYTKAAENIVIKYEDK